MSKLFTRATVTGSTLSGATLKSSLTTLWDALNGMGFTDASRVTVTATATLVTTQCGLLLVDCTSGNITLTLPTSGAATDDAVYNIRRIDATANTLNILRGGTDTLEGAATAVSVAAGGILGLQMPAGGTNWRVFNRANASDPDSRIQLQSATAFTSTGTAPTYVLTPIPAITAYTANQRFRVSAHAAGTTGSNTLKVSGLGVKSLKQYNSSGVKVSGVVAVGQLMDVEYDGTDFVILDPLPIAGTQIFSITSGVASNALTVGLNPTVLDFRNASVTSGVPVTRTVSAALSLVVPSTATLGTLTNVMARLVLLAIDFGGTVELAIVNLTGGVNLDETTLISTTAMSAAATSASVIYSTTARTNVAFRVVGFIDITETVAGTWAADATLKQGAGGNALTGLSGLGYGQTWQTVTRAASTTYYNTTGKPIVSSTVWVHSTSFGAVTYTINGVSINIACTGTQGTGGFGATCVIPAGATYSFTNSSGSYQSSAELR